MRKIILLLILVFTTTAIFAFTDNYGNYKNNENYNVLVANLKNAEDEKIVLESYEKYINSDTDNAMKTRVEFLMVTYYINILEDKAKATIHYNNAEEFYSTLTEKNEKQALAELDLASAKYLITKKQMSDGLKVSNLSKEYYKKYPAEIAIIIMEASRYSNTPKFAGGSPKKAIELFETMLQVTDQMQVLDRYMVYSNLGLAYKDNKDKVKSKEYLTKALAIYSGDTILVKALREL